MERLREKMGKKGYKVLDIYGNDEGFTVKFFYAHDYGELFIMNGKVAIIGGHVHIDTIELVNNIVGGEE